MTRPAPLMHAIRPELVGRRLTGVLEDTGDFDRAQPVPIPPTSSIGSENLAALLGFDTQSSRVRVTEGSVAGLPAVQAGVDMIAHAVAMMMTDANVYDAQGNQLDTPPVVSRPTLLMTSFEFWAALVDCVMKRGNAPAVLADFDDNGIARQVVPVHPDFVTIDDSTGLPWYTINNATYRWDEVAHVRHGAVWGSLWGQGVVERYRNALSRQLHEAEYGRASFASGGVPSAIIQLDKPKVTTEEAAEVQDRWIERHGSGQRKPAVIGKALSVTPLSWSPEDAEWAENRKCSVGEAALICGLHPADLGASLGGSLDYANITERQLARVLQSFMPWMMLAEQTWSDLLPEGQFVKGSVEALFRATPREELEMYEIATRIGLYTPEEIRTEKRRPPLPVTSEQSVENQEDNP